MGSEITGSGTTGSLAVVREMPADRLGPVTTLLDAATTPDGRRPLSDHLYVDLVNGGGEGFAGFIAATADGAVPVAYAQLSQGNDARLFEVVVHPQLAHSQLAHPQHAHPQHAHPQLAGVGTDAHADLHAALVTELLDAAFDVVATDGGGPLVWWVAHPTGEHRRIAAEAGMREHRHLHQMRRPLPAEPPTIETRAYRPGDDDAAWLRVNNRAFAGHGEQGGWTLDTLRARQGEPWFDADGFRVHERDGVLAGFCWTKVHPPSEGSAALGEIYVIAVDPDFHGLGLGKQLTLAGLDWLAARGITTGMLYVDGGNTTAVGMYERLGFHIHSTDVAFIADVPARRSNP